MRRLALLLLVVVGAAGCTKSVVVRTDPPGAVVKLDNRPIGKSPATFTDQGGAWKTYLLDIEAPGYVPIHDTLRQELSPTCVIASVAGGLLCILPFDALPFCGALPESNYFFRLEKLGAAREQGPTRGPQGPVEPAGPLAPVIPPL